MTGSFRTAQCWYLVALFGYFGLFILLMLWFTILAPSPLFPVSIMLLIAVSPLLLPLRGLLHGRPKSSAWAAYISLIYFIHGILEAYSNAGVRVYAALEIIFSLMLFFGATYYVRYTSKHRN